MRNKFVYSCSIKIQALGFDKILESIFCLLLVVEAFYLPKVVEMIEEVVVSWQEVRWLWWIRQNFIAQLVQLLKHWLCDVQSGVVMEKNWAHTVDQCWLQALQFFVQLINLFSILLRCNGFNQDSESSNGIRWAADHQTVAMTSFWWKFSFRKCFGVSSQPHHWASHHWLSYTIHFSLHITIWSRIGLLFFHRIREDNASKWRFFFFYLWSAHEAPHL